MEPLFFCYSTIAHMRTGSMVTPKIYAGYGIPIGVRDAHENLPQKPYRYFTVPNVQMLDQRLAESFIVPLAMIHTDLPRQIQQIMRENILHPCGIDYGRPLIAIKSHLQIVIKFSEVFYF